MPDTDDAIRVLHVDDQPAFAELVATYLEREHDRITVHSASSAEEGREVLASERVDCIVSDHDMPRENGIEFLRSVRAEYPELPFVLFTGKGSEEIASEAISAGVTDYLQKGPGSDQYTLLANRIVNAVEAFRSRQMLTERTRRLETLISTLPGIIYRCLNEPTWPMETADGEVEVLTGYTAAELEGDEVVWGEEVIHPDDQTWTWEAVQEALDDRERFELTYRIRTREGETRWVWERGRGVYDADGALEAIEGFITDVTERRERQRRLEQTTARLEALFEHSPDMIDVHDAEGNIVDANPQLCAETGYDVEELTSMAVWDLDRSIDREEGRELWREMEPGERLELEGRYERRDGSTFPAKIHVRRLDLDGEDRFLVSSRDISVRKRRDRKLEQLRERSRALNYTQTVEETARLAVDAAAEIIGADLSSVHMVTDDGNSLKPIAVGDPVAETFGEKPVYDQSAPSGTRANFAWDVFDDGDPTYLESTTRTSELEEETPAESVVFHPLGGHGLFIVSSPERAAYSETDRLLVEILANYLETALDRVAREEAHRARQRSLERLHNATRELVTAESRAAVAERVVAAAEDILGFSVVVVRFHDSADDELVPVAESDTVGGLLPPRAVFSAESPSLNWHAYKDGEARVYDDIEAVEGSFDAGTGLRSLMVLPMGEFGTLSVAETTPDAFDESDEFLAGILATAAETALDVLEGEQSLRESRNELRRQNERLEEFASVVSHDLRNPLNVATGRLEFVKDECDSEHLDAVERAHDRMGALIDDLLALARDGNDEIDPTSVDLATTARECWGNVETPGGTLVVTAERSIQADRRRLKQLFENLVRNAVEHGGDEVTVVVSDFADGFAVEDDGVGVAPADRESVFEAGFSTADGGTGFGLRIVKQVADAHGWDIRLTEGDDGGARFEVTGVTFVDE
ncbi:PAS domain S-box protein [Halobaculum marinum]|uniref:histidine kinase n=1 Tax=Halobaculum marinum TaxID=3031996 RepID=A0ABD5WWF9_9EURY|nr:PAS domain S-box protein [Halobaculum sp. DT55]